MLLPRLRPARSICLTSFLDATEQAHILDATTAAAVMKSAFYADFVLGIESC